MRLWFLALALALPACAPTLIADETEEAVLALVQALDRAGPPIISAPGQSPVQRLPRPLYVSQGLGGRGRGNLPWLGALAEAGVRTCTPRDSARAPEVWVLWVLQVEKNGPGIFRISTAINRAARDFQVRGSGSEWKVVEVTDHVAMLPDLWCYPDLPVAHTAGLADLGPGTVSHALERSQLMQRQ